MTAILSVSTSMRVLQVPNIKGAVKRIVCFLEALFDAFQTAALVLEPFCPGNQILEVQYLLITEH